MLYCTVSCDVVRDMRYGVSHKNCQIDRTYLEKTNSISILTKENTNFLLIGFLIDQSDTTRTNELREIQADSKQLHHPMQ